MNRKEPNICFIDFIYIKYNYNLIDNYISIRETQFRAAGIEPATI